MRAASNSGIDVVSSAVLVVGSGGAGLRAAIAARENGADVVVLGKRGRLDAHTSMAAGGINAALGTVDPEDSWQQHFADTMHEGYLLSHPGVAELMAREAPAAVLEVAGWGCEFARLPDGRLDQRFFGAHTWRRTCYAGDHTGRDIVDTLVRRAEALGVRFVERVYVWRLVVEDGRCAGALAFDVRTGDRAAFVASAVVLATGGHTSLWRTNTSRQDENHGEGMALALRAGCRLMDMELVQFHPTGLVAPPEVAGTLVTEAVRGEGGRLYNAKGERFMSRYDSRRMELSTRDRVALANYTEIMSGRGGPNGGVFLDVSHRGRDHILERLPTMHRQLLAFQGLDISKEPMEVAPTAHYSMGGIAVDPDTHATDVPGLFAAGECAAGLHGANRLGGNSLVDTLVFGRRSGAAAAAAAREQRGDALPRSRDIAEGNSDLDDLIGRSTEDVGTLQRQLREVMWRNCGVLRDETGLREGLGRLEEIRSALGPVDAGAENGWVGLGRALDLRAALLTAEATLRCAIERRETRGCHNRSDHRNLDPAMQRNFYARQAPEGALTVWGEPVPAVADELMPWLESARELDLSERLLE